MRIVLLLTTVVAFTLACAPSARVADREAAPSKAPPAAAAAPTSSAVSKPEASAQPPDASSTTPPSQPAPPAPEPELVLSPAPIDGDVPPLGPFDEAALPRSKYALLMVVDEALRKGDREILGRVTFDAATMKRRCPGRSEKMAALRAESGRAFAACAGFVDWSQAERFALDDNAHLGSPPRSCGFHKAGAKLQYSTDGKVVEIDVRAVAYPGARRYALVQPIACRVRHTYDREGKTIATSPEAVLKGSKSARRHCPHLPWPHVFGRDGAARISKGFVKRAYRCPKP